MAALDAEMPSGSCKNGITKWGASGSRLCNRGSESVKGVAVVKLNDTDISSPAGRL
jgi:hypothetical protein